MSRNAIARDLRTPKYRQRVINGKGLAMPEAEEYLSECDCCGEMKYDCVDLVWRHMDVHACAKCRNEEDDANDMAANRGDYEFHRDHDQ